jgi:hypothetical protein
MCGRCCPKALPASFFFTFFHVYVCCYSTTLRADGKDFRADSGPCRLNCNSTPPPQFVAMRQRYLAKRKTNNYSVMVTEIPPRLQV